MKYYAGITAKCTVGPAGKPCDGKESGQCTGEITLTQLDAATTTEEQWAAAQRFRAKTWHTVTFL